MHPSPSRMTVPALLSSGLLLLVSVIASPAQAGRTASQKARGAEATRLNRAGFRKPDGSQFSRKDIQRAAKPRGPRDAKRAAERQEHQREVTRFIAEFVSDDGPAAHDVKILSVQDGRIRFTAPGFEGEVSMHREEGWVLDHATGKTTRIH